MRIRWYLLFSLVLFLSFNCKVMALECNDNYILELKELANNISYEQEYIGDDVNPQLYRVSFDNIDSGLYLEYLSSGSDRLLINDKNKIINLKSGISTFDVYSLKCSSKVRTITIDLPKFNEYSESDECRNNDLDICDKWYQGEVTEEKFDELISQNEKSQTNTYSYDNVYDFVLNNIYYFAVGFVLLIALIILLIHIKKRNSYLR